ncbi:MAG: LemA family protein [Gemmatimonadaceae bacterium]
MSRSPRFLFVALIPLALTGCGYNTIQRHDEQAAQAKQQIDVQLQRRADLVPNLVATVRGYARQEETIFIEVARARSGLLNAIQSGGAAEAAAANAQLTGALGRLLVTVENYPQLKSDQNFLRLQDELAGTENRIAVARTDYNAAVNQYNAYIRTLPQKLTAMVTGAKPREYFNAPEGTETPPTVDFSPSTN